GGGLAHVRQKVGELILRTFARDRLALALLQFVQRLLRLFDVSLGRSDLLLRLREQRLALRRQRRQRRLEALDLIGNRWQIRIGLQVLQLAVHAFERVGIGERRAFDLGILVLGKHLGQRFGPIVFGDDDRRLDFVTILLRGRNFLVGRVKRRAGLGDLFRQVIRVVGPRQR